jgi:glycosyltransferase involved in cell wall biosynthesis
MKICIVTPDLAGPVRNGGIGTYARSLAILLRRAGHEVTLVFSMPLREDGKAWMAEYHREQVRVLRFRDIADPGDQAPRGPAAHLAISLTLCQWLRGQPFELVHFQDWRANGFHAIQAKRAGVAFNATALCVTLHSPTLWSNLETPAPPGGAADMLRLNACERYCIEHADHVLSPSNYMLGWAREQGWRPRGSVELLAYPHLPGEAAPTSALSGGDPQHLVFFGRLEERKGLRVFCDALVRHAAASGSSIRQVTFLGKETKVDGRSTRHWIDAVRRQCPDLRIDLRTDLDAGAAIAFIRRTGGIACMPSLRDNAPYAVIECIGAGIPFFVSRIGGMPEMCDPKALFDPTVEGLLGLFQRLGKAPPPFAHAYSAERANQAVLDWYRDRTPSPPARAERSPRVRLAQPRESAPADADWLLFLAPGTQPGSALQATFEQALAITQADVVTCLYTRDEGPFRRRRIRHPLGNCLLPGLLENLLAGPAFAMRRTMVDALGGLPDGFDAGERRWALLLEAVVAGREVAVIPDVLCHYHPVRPRSRLAAAERLAAHRVALQPLLRTLDPDQRAVFEQILLPFHDEHAGLTRILDMLPVGLRKALYRKGQHVERD